MFTGTTEAINGKGRLEETLANAGKVAAVGIDIGTFKKQLENAVDDAVYEAQRMAKHGKNALEDAIDDTTHRIKKNPWQAVGYVLGAGIGLGLFAGFLMKRQSSDRVH